MNKLLTWVVAGVIGLSMAGASFEAEAQKRFGGGSSFGMKRDAFKAPRKDAAPKQAQQPGAAGAPAAAGAAGAAGKAMPGWLGPVGGLLAGGLLAAMFFGGAFDGLNFGDFLMIGLLVAAAIFVMRMMRSRAQPPATYRTSTGDSVPGTPPAAMGGSGVPMSPAVAEGRIPADFDVQGFIRNAKMSFIRLQAANDAKDLTDIRDYTTPQVYATVAMQMQERGNVAQRTEVVSIDAQLLQVVTEDDKVIASVRFTGLIREDNAANPDPVDEVWHVEKSLKDRDSAWLIAGIQQVEEEA